MNDILPETRGLTKEFKGFIVVDKVDLKVARGATLAEGPCAEVPGSPAVVEADMGGSGTRLQGTH